MTTPKPYKELSERERFLPGCIYDKGMLVYVGEGNEDRFCREMNAQRVIVVDPPVGQPAASAKPVAQWLPIESAPKDGTEILAYRGDCGVFIARYTSCDAFLCDTELAKMDDETIFAQDWFCADFISGERLEGNLIPTHWMPLPAAPGKEG